jgi:hypothetical protein
MTLRRLWATVIRHWKLAGAPRRPIRVVTQWYWPWLGAVKAVYRCALGCSKSKQNLDIRLRVVKIVLSDLLKSPMHALMFYMEHCRF